MKIHFYSDIHADINNIQNPATVIDTSEHADLYIDAGDTGSLLATQRFYRNSFWNDKQAVFIAGNHLCYGIYDTLSTVEESLSNEFHINNNVSFLQNSEKHFGDIVVLGTTLWTDFKVFGSQELSLKYAVRALNDFRSVMYTEDAYLSPKDTVVLNSLAKKYIHKRLKKNPTKKYIIVTHHTPSLRSSSPQYLNDPITPCFCNDMEDFIEQHDNILMWIHGHVHNAVYYMIGNVPIICNPYGYKTYQEASGYVSNAVLEV